MLAEINGTPIYYEVIGQGRPIMVMHGGLGLDHTYFRPWLDPLAEDFQLIFFDFSGNGRSPRSSFDGVTHETWANEADALREHLGIERMVLMGQSYGGFLAQEYAVRHQDRLDALILLCTAPALDYPDIVIGNAQKRGTPEQVTALIEGLSNPAANDDALRTLMGTIMSLYFKRPDPAIAAAIDARMTYSAGGFNHAFGVCVPTYNVTDRLTEITVPTLVLAGRDDWICPPAQADRMLAKLPHADSHIFEESGHFPFIEEQPAFLETVRSWVNGLD